MKNGRMSGELSTQVLSRCTAGTNCAAQSHCNMLRVLLAITALMMVAKNQDLFAATAGNVNTSGLLLSGAAHWNTISLRWYKMWSTIALRNYLKWTSYLIHQTLSCFHCRGLHGSQDYVSCKTSLWNQTLKCYEGLRSSKIVLKKHAFIPVWYIFLITSTGISNISELLFCNFNWSSKEAN